MNTKGLGSNSRGTFALIEASALLCHELTEKERLSSLYRRLYQDGILERPILVDRHSLVILDGHHRFECLKRLGCSLIPAYLVDYQDPAIRVESRRQDTWVSKDVVVKRGLGFEPFPPRTTRHTLGISLPPYPVQLNRLMTTRPSSRRQTAAPSPNW